MFIIEYIQIYIYYLNLLRNTSYDMYISLFEILSILSRPIARPPITYEVIGGFAYRIL